MSGRKLPSNSAEGQVTAAQSREQDFPTPENHPKLFGKDKIRWKSFTSARETWTEAELVMLYEGIVTFRDLDACREAAANAPILTVKSSGEEVAHPIHHELRQREKSLQTWLRQVGLTTSPDRAAASRTKAKPNTPASSGNVRSLIG